MGQSYDTHYNPPIPIINVSFGLPEENPNTGPFDAIIDTGADTTVVPKEILLRMGAPSLMGANLRSPWGELHEVMLYLVDIQAGTVHLPGIEVAGDENAQEIILGRNVLNKLLIFLDGPQSYTELLEHIDVRRLRTRRGK